MLSGTNNLNGTEEQFDENGRLIVNNNVDSNAHEGNLFTSSNKNTEEDEYDENGRLITGNKSISNAYEGNLFNSTNQVSKQDEYDENGRLITNTNSYNETYDSKVDIINSVEEVKASLSTSYISADDYDIKFAKLNNNDKFLNISDEMLLEDNVESFGLFFINNAKEEMLKMNIELTNSTGDLIWESEIGRLPENRLVLKGVQAKNMYISKRVLRKQDLPAGDESYYASIREIDNDSKILSLDICDNREEDLKDNTNTFSFETAVGLNNDNNITDSNITEEQQVDNISFFKPVNPQNNENINLFDSITSESIDNINFFKPVITQNEESDSSGLLSEGELINQAFLNNAMENHGHENDDYVEEDYSDVDCSVLEELVKQDITELVYKNIGSRRTRGNSLQDESNTTNEAKEIKQIVEPEKIIEKLVYPTDIKSIVIQEVMNHTPVSIDCRMNDTATKMISSLVIEKIGNYYVVILNGFMNRPIYILNGEERYFEFEGNIIEFINKIKSIICRMYSMTTNEFESLTKLIILDEENSNDNIKEDDKIKIIQRKTIFENIVQVNEQVIIDLLTNSCNLVFNDEEGKTVKIICEGLGYKNGENVLNAIQTLAEKIGYDRVVLTGLFVNSEFTDKFINEDKECTIGTLSKYVSM